MLKQLALSAASPIYRGYLSDTDCRWSIIGHSVDCRTPGERGLEPLNDNEIRIRTSRYSAIESYLSENGDKYNDIPLVYDEEVYNQLLDNGIDRLLAQHVAHLFIRDCVCLMSTQLNQNDETDTDHFEVKIYFHFISFINIGQFIFIFAFIFRIFNQQIGNQ